MQTTVAIRFYLNFPFVIIIFMPVSPFSIWDHFLRLEP